MIKTKYVFIVVLYKNCEDLIDLVGSIEKWIPDYQIIIVNNYADDDSLRKIRLLSKKINKCVLIEQDNRGYGAGNNTGIKYALDNIDFEYLVICNSDTIIRFFDSKYLLDPSYPAIYAPDIICSSGKRQNPNWSYESKMIETIQYLACKHSSIILDYFAIGLLKISRKYKQLICSRDTRSEIYSAHGAFLIVSISAVKMLNQLYDENMFLFYEEVYLAHLAKANKIKTYYTPGIIIRHKEDGSMRMANIDQKIIAHRSVVYFHEHYRGHYDNFHSNY